VLFASRDLGLSAGLIGLALGIGSLGGLLGAAIAPAAGSFNDPEITTMIFVGAVVCLALSFGAARWLRHRSPAGQPVPA
jgi:hypothetical protein